MLVLPLLRGAGGFSQSQERFDFVVIAFDQGAIMPLMVERQGIQPQELGK